MRLIIQKKYLISSKILNKYVLADSQLKIVILSTNNLILEHKKTHLFSKNLSKIAILSLLLILKNLFWKNSIKIIQTKKEKKLKKRDLLRKKFRKRQLREKMPNYWQSRQKKQQKKNIKIWKSKQIWHRLLIKNLRNKSKLRKKLLSKLTKLLDLFTKKLIHNKIKH